MDKKFDIKQEDIEDAEVGRDFDDKWKRAREVMLQRTSGFELYARVSHNQSIYDKKRKDVFSEGSTQAIKRKIRAQTIQRLPDGELVTPFDKNSIEQVEIEYLFDNKIMLSEYENKDMLKNLWKSFGNAYDYGFSCVRTGFETDVDGNYRISYTEIPWNDIYPAPDCKCIEEAEWYIVREWISRSELEALLDDDGKCTDKTYNEQVVQYLVENESKDGIEPFSLPYADRKKGAFPTESVEVRTLYKRGDKSFVSFVNSCRAVLREVDNYDPRLDVPLHFLVLDPDPEFPLGASSVMWTLAQQQFADAFQTSAYDTLLISTQPPIMGFGNLTPSKIKMKPRAFWPMGTNPNNKVEKFPVETTVVTQYGSILENIQSRMLTALNIQDGTIASDANTMAYSKTAPGVKQQQADKTITVNQYQKRIEIFFSEWANHALRSYINAMGGTHEMTVDEETRRKIWSIEMSEHSSTDPMQSDMESIIEDDKISIDFDNLSTEMLSFVVRTGSLIESEKDVELEHVQETIVPISQMLGSVSDQNKSTFENILLKLVARLLEMSDIDVSAETGQMVNEQLLMGAMQATMEQVMGQQGQIDQMSQQIGALQGAAMPQGAGALSAPEGGMAEEAMPAPGAPAAPGTPDMGGETAPQVPPELIEQLTQAGQAPSGQMPPEGTEAPGGLPLADESVPNGMPPVEQMM